MLTDAQLEALEERLHLPPAARQIVRQVRDSQPSRRVRSVVGNVTCSFPSLKMGVTIQSESHLVELPFVVAMETDPHVFEFHDQPPTIKLSYHSEKEGKRRQTSWLHTPDYFVISQGWIGWVECKPEGELERLSEKRPWRFEKRDGKWRCPPGEEYAECFGLSYRVWSSAEIDWKLYDNILLLQDYLRPDLPPPDTTLVESVLRFVDEERGITLANLLERVCGDSPVAADLIPRGESPGRPQALLEPGSVADAVYTMIVTQALYVDLKAEHLADAWRVRVFRNLEAASTYDLRTQTPVWALPSALSPTLHFSAGALVTWDGQTYQVINRGESETTLLDECENGRLVILPNDRLSKLAEDGKIAPLGQPNAALSEETLDLRSRVSTKDEAQANQRFASLSTYLLDPGSTPDSLKDTEGIATIPSRTARRLRARYLAARERHGCGYDGLLPLHFRKGNRNAKLPQESVALMRQFIAEKFETIERPPVRAIYGRYLRACDKIGVIAASYITFCRYVRERPLHEQERKRKGSRGAYKSEAWYWHLERGTPRHGNHPFHIVHVDHTQDDLELRCAETGVSLGRPWTSIATDAFTRRVLAVFVSFDRPDARTCMMLMREIVRRHRRVPQTVVVDGGKEFHSTYFDTLLARLECLKKQRPGKPRFGSVIERVFGTTNTQLFYNLKGNTQITRDVRQMTKSVNPKALAVWNLEALYYSLCEYCYTVYDTTPHPSLGCSPREAARLGEAQFGARAHRKREYDDEFVRLTMPTTDRGTAKVQSNGVKLHHIYYWSDSFREAGVLGSQVEVRYDPYDAGVIYARANNRWVRCHSEHYATFRNRSQREVKLLTEALRNRFQQHGRQFNISARKLADFLNTAEGQEAVMEQHMKDEALRPILKLVNNRNSAGGGAVRLAGGGDPETSLGEAATLSTFPTPPTSLTSTAPTITSTSDAASLATPPPAPSNTDTRASMGGDGTAGEGNSKRKGKRDGQERAEPDAGRPRKRDFVVCEDF